MVLPQVVWAYRGQYRIEDDWSRLKGRPLGLTPMYLQDEERMQGVVRPRNRTTETAIFCQSYHCDRCMLIHCCSNSLGVKYPSAE